MNGFFINPDRWFFELFGYEVYGGQIDDYDWLASWDAISEEFTLTGMESLQSIYTAFWSKPQHRKINDIVDLLIVLEFQRLIAQSFKLIDLPIHMLATAHEFDFIYEAIPKKVS